MQRDGQLDDAKACAKMAAGDGHGVDRLMPQFVGDLFEIDGLQLAQIVRRLNRVEKRRL